MRSQTFTPPPVAAGTAGPAVRGPAGVTPAGAAFFGTVIVKARGGPSPDFTPRWSAPPVSTSLSASLPAEARKPAASTTGLPSTSTTMSPALSPASRSGPAATAASSAPPRSDGSRQASPGKSVHSYASPSAFGVGWSAV